MFEVGKKYIGVKFEDGIVYEVKYVGNLITFVAYNLDGRNIEGSIPNREFVNYKEYKEPVKYNGYIYMYNDGLTTFAYNKFKNPKNVFSCRKITFTEGEFDV